MRSLSAAAAFSIALHLRAVHASCSGTDFPAGQAALSSGALPPTFTPVLRILPSDTDGQNLFASFKDSIPNIAVRGKDGVPDPAVAAAYDPSDPDCWWSYTKCTQPKIAGLEPDVGIVPEPQTMGYGFDDGPACQHEAFLDFMDTKKQKATFFYIGSNVISMPLEAQRAATDGHEICVHGWSHHPMTSFDNEAAFSELYYTMKAIKLVTGYTPKCWRPPTGDVDDRIRFIAQKLGLTNVLWEYDANDWRFGDGSLTADKIRANYDAFIADASAGKFAQRGTIILTHELDNFTMQTAVDYHPKLSAVFKHIVPIAVALNRTNPYVETTMTMPTFDQLIGAAGPSTPSTSSAASSSAPNPSSPISSASSQKAAPAGSKSSSAPASTSSTASTLSASSNAQSGASRTAMMSSALFVSGLLLAGAWCL